MAAPAGTLACAETTALALKFQAERTTAAPAAIPANAATTAIAQRLQELKQQAAIAETTVNAVLALEVVAAPPSPLESMLMPANAELSALVELSAPADQSQCAKEPPELGARLPNSLPKPGLMDSNR
jgi:hypothetical protein